MADITTKVLYENDIEVLGDKYNFLKNIDLNNPVFRDWQYLNIHKLGYEKIKTLKIIFIGQTGYGKSTLINKLINKNIFETSDYQSCTKILQSADYFLHHKAKKQKLAYLLSFVDLPGIGESDQADEDYLKWYQQYIQESTVIIYLFRADKRDHTQDEFFFNNVFDKTKVDNLICVISQADKIEPINRSMSLSTIQKNNLKKKKNDIINKTFLNFGEIDITYVSSYLNYNISDLEDKIIYKLKQQLGYINKVHNSFYNPFGF